MEKTYPALKVMVGPCGQGPAQWPLTPCLCVADVDECELGTHNCQVGFTCQNTKGSFYCQARQRCMEGFLQDPEGNCVGERGPRGCGRRPGVGARGGLDGAWLGGLALAALASLLVNGHVSAWPLEALVNQNSCYPEPPDLG